MKLRTNRERLVMVAAIAEATQPVINTGLYDVSQDGRPLITPSVGGINPNVRVGDSAFGFVADHIEPGVSAKNPDDRANTAFCVYSCVGNEAIIVTGEAKGETGVVTGKHGGIEHVLIDFDPKVLKRMVVGDKIQVWAQGVGLELTDAPEIGCFNLAPDFLDEWGVELRKGKPVVPVTRVVPAAVMGSGLGRTTVARGDYDIQTFDDAMSEQYGLREIKLGDIVAIADADHSHGRIYFTGAISVGIVVHGASNMAGHGPGVTTLLTSRTGNIQTEIDKNANIAKILNLR